MTAIASSSGVTESSSAITPYGSGWLKVSNSLQMTAEPVLNHLLRALAFGENLGLRVTIDHYERPHWKTIAGNEHDSD